MSGENFQGEESTDGCNLHDGEEEDGYEDDYQDENSSDDEEMDDIQVDNFDIRWQKWTIFKAMVKY